MQFFLIIYYSARKDFLNVSPFVHAENWSLKLLLYRVVYTEKKGNELIVRCVLSEHIDRALDLIKSWIRDSVDYQTSRCYCCCNVADPSRTSRRRGCWRCRSGWSPTRKYLCTGKGRRILSHCKAADSPGRSIPRSFCKPQRDLTTKLNCFLKIFLTNGGDRKCWILKLRYLILSNCKNRFCLYKKKRHFREIVKREHSWMAFPFNWNKCFYSAKH